MHREELLVQMKQMHLSAMADTFVDSIESGTHRELSHEEFVALLIESEVATRKTRKITRMINGAHFKPEKACIENLRWDPKRGFDKKDIIPLTQRTWFDKTEHVILTGPAGAGKSYLAEALGLQACRFGLQTRKIRFTMLFEEIQSAKGTGSYLKYLKKLSKYKVLILDDFLMNSITQQNLSDLMDIVEEREQTGNFIITTQYPPNKWHLKMPDPTIADALCDRLINRAVRISMKGESMRKKKE